MITLGPKYIPYNYMEPWGSCPNYHEFPPFKCSILGSGSFMVSDYFVQSILGVGELVNKSKELRRHSPMQGLDWNLKAYALYHETPYPQPSASLNLETLYPEL